MRNKTLLIGLVFLSLNCGHLVAEERVVALSQEEVRAAVKKAETLPVAQLRDLMKKEENQEKKRIYFTQLTRGGLYNKKDVEEYFATVRAVDDGSRKGYEFVRELNLLSGIYSNLGLKENSDGKIAVKDGRFPKEKRELEDAFIAHLEDKNKTIQTLSIKGLGFLRSEKGKSHLIKKWQDHPGFGSPAKFVLSEFMSNVNSLKSAEVYNALSSALEEIGDEDCFQALVNRDDLWKYGDSSLSVFGAKVLPYVIQNLDKADKRRGAINTLVRIEDPAATQELYRLTKSDDAEVKNAAFHALENASDSSINSDLEKRLHDPDPEVRGFAAKILIRRDSQKYAEKVMPMLFGEMFGSCSADSAKPYQNYGAENGYKPVSTVALNILGAILRDPPGVEVNNQLKDFIKVSEDCLPNWPMYRQVAAQIIFKTSGERVPCKGIEKRNLYGDPYVP